MLGLKEGNRIISWQQRMASSESAGVRHVDVMGVPILGNESCVEVAEALGCVTQSDGDMKPRTDFSSSLRFLILT